MTLTVATNSDGSIYKFYGHFRMTKTVATGEMYAILKNTGIVPTQAFEVLGNTQFSYNESTVYPMNYEVLANGNIKVGFGGVYYPGDNSAVRRGFLCPALYFAKDFGDTPSND